MCVCVCVCVCVCIDMNGIRDGFMPFIMECIYI